MNRMTLRPMQPDGPAVEPFTPAALDRALDGLTADEIIVISRDGPNRRAGAETRDSFDEQRQPAAGVNQVAPEHDHIRPVFAGSLEQLRRRAP